MTALLDQQMQANAAAAVRPSSNVAVAAALDDEQIARNLDSALKDAYRAELADNDDDGNESSADIAGPSDPELAFEMAKRRAQSEPPKAPRAEGHMGDSHANARTTASSRPTRAAAPGVDIVAIRDLFSAL